VFLWFAGHSDERQVEQSCLTYILVPQIACTQLPIHDMYGGGVYIENLICRPLLFNGLVPCLSVEFPALQQLFRCEVADQVAGPLQHLQQQMLFYLRMCLQGSKKANALDSIGSRGGMSAAGGGSNLDDQVAGGSGRRMQFTSSRG
jgi:hypothetical protein